MDLKMRLPWIIQVDQFNHLSLEEQKTLFSWSQSDAAGDIREMQSMRRKQSDIAGLKDDGRRRQTK